MTLWEALGLPAAPRLALIGGGGKTSALFQLAREASSPPLLTTTTRMFFPREHLDWLTPGRFGEPLPAGIPFVYSHVERQDKVLGISPQQLEELQWDGPLLYEADGSRGRPVKLHGSGEPVLADSTTHTVVVLGLSAWGRPLDDSTAHRSELLGDLFGEILDLQRAEKLLRRMLERTRGVPLFLLNQASSEELKEAGAKIKKKFSGEVRVAVREHSWTRG